MPRTAPASERAAEGAYVFLLLACGITWALDLPYVLACLTGEAASPVAMGLVGLGAWGPAIAALLVARLRGEGGVFRRWSAPAKWILVALAAPALLHVGAGVVEVALGGAPAQWIYPPTNSEAVVALVMFSLGEELGWRAFAYPRLARRHGPVVGSLLLGAVWGLWHLGMFFTPEQGAPAVGQLVRAMAELALLSVIVAWCYERGGRGFTVALAFHVGLHLDNVSRAPESDARVLALRFILMALVAGVAGRSLLRRPP